MDYNAVPNFLRIICSEGEMNGTTVLSLLFRIPGYTYLFPYLIATHIRAPHIKEAVLFPLPQILSKFSKTHLFQLKTELKLVKSEN